MCSLRLVGGETHEPSAMLDRDLLRYRLHWLEVSTRQRDRVPSEFQKLLGYADPTPGFNQAPPQVIIFGVLPAITARCEYRFFFEHGCAVNNPAVRAKPQRY